MRICFFERHAGLADREMPLELPAFDRRELALVHLGPGDGRTSLQETRVADEVVEGFHISVRCRLATQRQGRALDPVRRPRTSAIGGNSRKRHPGAIQNDPEVIRG